MTIWDRVRGELEVQEHETQTFRCTAVRNKSQESTERTRRDPKTGTPSWSHAWLLKPSESWTGQTRVQKSEIRV